MQPREGGVGRAKEDKRVMAAGYLRVTFGSMSGQPHERPLPPPSVHNSALRYALATIVLSVLALVLAVLRIAG